MILDPSKPIGFLDIDGVLNSANYFKNNVKNPDISREENQLDPQAIEFLNEIADWNWVLSSTWRKFKTLEQINTLLASRGFKGTVISATPELSSPCLRGNEIYEWMGKNIPNSSDFTNYAVFDDDSDFLYWQRNNLFLTDGYWGIGPGQIYRAKRFLKLG